MIQVRFEFSDGRAPAERDLPAVPCHGGRLFWEDETGATEYRVHTVDWAVSQTAMRARVRLLVPPVDPITRGHDPEAHWQWIVRGRPER